MPTTRNTITIKLLQTRTRQTIITTTRRTSPRKTPNTITRTHRRTIRSKIRTIIIQLRNPTPKLTSTNTITRTEIVREQTNIININRHNRRSLHQNLPNIIQLHTTHIIMSKIDSEMMWPTRRQTRHRPIRQRQTNKRNTARSIITNNKIPKTTRTIPHQIKLQNTKTRPIRIGNRRN